MAADEVHLLLVSDVDLILQDFRLFLGIARQDAFQSPVEVTKNCIPNRMQFFFFYSAYLLRLHKVKNIIPDLFLVLFIQKFMTHMWIQQFLHVKFMCAVAVHQQID